MKIQRSTQRLLLFVAALPATLVIMAIIYMTGMAHFEESPRTFMESLQWATETLTEQREKICADAARMVKNARQDHETPNVQGQGDGQA